MKKADILVALSLVPISLYVFYESGKWPKEALIGAPTLIPWGVAMCPLWAAAMLLIKALRGRALALADKLAGADRRRIIGAALLAGAYVFAVPRLGFIITTFFFLLVFGLVLGERRWVHLILFAIATPVVIYLIFSTILNVPLPPGLFR
jgi:putative tricarboxylic transport membrane protein